LQIVGFEKIEAGSVAAAAFPICAAIASQRRWLPLMRGKRRQGTATPLCNETQRAIVPIEA
jgi:hypothetical protein